MNGKILSKIYYNPSHSASFGSAKNLFIAAKQIQPSITLNEVKDWLSGELTYTLHKPARRRFPRNKVIAEFPNEQFQADLVDMQEFSRNNNGNKYILTVIDVFSKYAWAIPLKDKTGREVKKALEKIFNERQPLKLQTDRGLEFENQHVKNMLKIRKIHYFTSQNSDIKCAVVERFNRTLKGKMFKYFSSRGTRKYVDVIDKLVKGYNRTKHRTIKARPIDVTMSNAQSIFKNIYGVKGVRNLLKKKNISKLKVGDKVRRKYELKPMEKGYYPNWTDTMYTVEKTIKGDRPTIKIKQEDNTILAHGFYDQELQKVKETVHRAQVIRSRKKGQQKEYLVRWLGYPTWYNTWIPEQDLIRLNG